MAFALGKKIVLANPVSVKATPQKSLQNVLLALSARTYQEFLEKLREASFNWHLTNRNQIRAVVNDICYSPVTAVAKFVTGKDYDELVRFAGWDIGLSDKLVLQIHLAMDNDTAHYDPKIRKDLLEACGLREKSTR